MNIVFLFLLYYLDVQYASLFRQFAKSIRTNPTNFGYYIGLLAEVRYTEILL
jgi:hypothetical protein